MIALRSKEDSVFYVYDDDKLIGYIHRQRGSSGDVYLATIDKDGEEKAAGKIFESPNDALLWIDKNRYMSGK